jgi:Flp pilus assembly protein TadG
MKRSNEDARPNAKMQIQLTMKKHFPKGQMMVLFILAMPVLLGVMALGADFAIIYLNWTIVQKAVDAAALAGASQLTGEPGSASRLLW